MPAPQQGFYEHLGLATVFLRPADVSAAGMLLWGLEQGRGGGMCGLVAGCTPRASLCWDVGFAKQGQPASGQGPSILAGKQQQGGRGVSLPVLSPDVISPPWGGTVAKGRVLLATAAPSLLAGVLVIWAVAGDRVCPGSPQAGGTRGFGMLPGKRQRDVERDGGRFLGSQLTVPLLRALGRGHRAAVKTDVH